MAREYVKWGEWNKINLNPKTNKSNEENPKKEMQKKQFAKCKICGGQMTFLKGTNTLICLNEVEKTIETSLSDGKKSKSIVKEQCGNIKLVSEPYQGYMRYLFEN